MYVLRVEIELDPRDCVDDLAARQAAREMIAKMRLPCERVTVKLQKRHLNAPPRAVKL